MNTKFVSYQIALKLKELGFNEKCFGYFTKDEVFFYFDVDDFSSSYTKNLDNLIVNSVDKLYCTAPLWQDAIDWLFKELDFYYPSLTLTVYLDKSGCWIQTKDDGVDELEIDFNNQEEMILKIIEKLQK